MLWTDVILGLLLDQETTLLSPTSYIDGRYYILLIATARVNLCSP
jgi:hypothetical protein